MKCIMGIVRPAEGRIVAEIDGEKHDLVGMPTEKIVDLGIALVPEGRRLFPKLTVEENLLLGAFRPKARAQIKTNMDFCCTAFPRDVYKRQMRSHAVSTCGQRYSSVVRPCASRILRVVIWTPRADVSSPSRRKRPISSCWATMPAPRPDSSLSTRS